MKFKYRFRSFISVILLKLYFPKIIFRLIESPEELEKMYNLIWEVYGMEKKYIDTDQFSQDILKDGYEKTSIKIGAFDDENLIGTIRIILPSPEGFYVEKDFNVDLTNFPYEKIAELSRLVVREEYRNSLISFGLLKKALEESKKIGIKYWIVVISEKVKNYFSKFFGINFQVLKLKELTEKQLEARKKMINYYKVCNPIPYIISIEEIS